MGTEVHFDILCLIMCLIKTSCDLKAQTVSMRKPYSVCNFQKYVCCNGTISSKNVITNTTNYFFSMELEGT